MKRVLILCTGNSCRSQMAETMLNKLGKGGYRAFSAGAKPAGHVHPLAIETLSSMQYSIEGLRSKSMDEFKNQAFDLVITVCDRARDVCPVWPGAQTLHWSFEDPAEASGSETEKRAVFRRVATEIQQRIRLFLSIPQQPT
jgi:arsenate reductase (thioredoxin)